jgi:hypothetical protein
MSLIRRIREAVLLGSLLAAPFSPADEPKEPTPVVETENNTLKDILDDPQSFKFDVYSIDDALGLNLKLERENGDIIREVSLDSRIHDTGINFDEITFKLVKLTDNYFFGAKGGLYAPTELLEGAIFSKLQFGTRPSKHDFNYLVGFMFLRAPNISYQNSLESNIICLNAALNYSPMISFKNFLLKFNVDSNISLFWQPFFSDGLEAVPQESRRIIFKKGVGDPAILAFSHWKTDFDIIFETQHVNAGLINDVDLASTIIHNHRLFTKVKYKMLNVDYSFGARFFHNFYTDVTERGQALWNYGGRTDLISLVNLNVDLPWDLSLKGYLEFNHSNNDLNRYLATLTKNLGKWDFELYSMYDNYRDTFSVGIMVSFGFEKKEKLDPEDYDRWYYPTEGIKPSTVGFLGGFADEPLHAVYGPTLEDAIKKIHNYNDLSMFVRHFKYERVDYGFESPEEVYAKGGSNCEGVNGSLIPYVLKRSLGLKSGYAPLIEPGFYHVIGWAMNERGTYDLWDYGTCYETGETDLKRAIEKTFPGAIITRDGAMPVVEKVRKLLEERLYDK